MSLEIKSYEQKYFNELCLVMDRARKQELQAGNPHLHGYYNFTESLVQI